MCVCGQDLVKTKRSGKVRYWIDYTVDKKSRREAVGFSIEEARTAEGKRKTQKYENPRILQKVLEERWTFQQLTDWYLALDKVKAQAYYPTLKINLASFNAEFGNKIVSQIKPADLGDYQAKRKAAGKADSYVDQEITAARTVVNRAFDNDKVSMETVKVFKRVKKLLKRGSNKRDRILTPEEFERLLNHAPRLTKDILVMGYWTGMREGEILGLTWDKVDMQGRVIRLEAADCKDREKRQIPIPDELYKTLKAIPRVLHDRHVFQYKGQPVSDIRTGLQMACEKAGIPYGRFTNGGFVFHDLRHTFNTNMRKAGVAASVIMTITGHSSMEMFRRYDTVDQGDQAKAVDQMRDYLQNLDQNLDQVPSEE